MLTIIIDTGQQSGERRQTLSPTWVPQVITMSSVRSERRTWIARAIVVAAQINVESLRRNQTAEIDVLQTVR